jgi:hypothetical protein
MKTSELYKQKWNDVKAAVEAAYDTIKPGKKGS